MSSFCEGLLLTVVLRFGLFVAVCGAAISSGAVRFLLFDGFSSCDVRYFACWLALDWSDE